ncbi:MAG: ribonuclease H-like domain-containing protein [Lachnospiraceae bacterium]|nr:ribonuclease H-like domain-containing protein [Lachnospiraceae bacterium]
MITVNEPFIPEQFYPGICPFDRKMLFFDIETTGFSREFHMIYLIGAASFRDGKWQLMQWFAQTPDEEAEVIRAFLDFSKDYDTLIHFNGQRFDLPFTRARADACNIPWTLDFEESIDLMNLIKPYKAFCGLENCRQKSVENLLGLSSREDCMTGGELIPVYYHYVHKNDPKSLHLLLLHNADDVRCMTGLTQVAQWPDFFHSDFQFQNCSFTQEGIVFHYESNLRMPVLLNADFDFWQISAGGNTLSLGVHFIEGERKHFYKNYRDYYYLPDEDIAVHKSIAEFVDKAHRKKATKQNCCMKHQGPFLPQPEVLITPEFAEKPNDKITCFLYNGQTPDADFANSYLLAVLRKYIKDYQKD